MDDAELLSKFEDKRELYSSFAHTVGNLIERLLVAQEINAHSVSFRCKTIHSFREKISKKSAYQELEEVTDLAGIRLISHYEDDVDIIAEVVESEFVIDRANSIDKRKTLEPDKFGYLSMHYVVSLTPERAALKEYQHFANLKAEIQIRSILQHAWAEIEHDTGYKSEVEVPVHIRRRFSRLAGLLEIADSEFIGIRKALLEYSVDVASRVESLSSHGDKTTAGVLIDGVSLVKFIQLDPLALQLNADICTVLNAKTSPNPKSAMIDIQRLKYFGIETLDALGSALELNKDYIVKRAEQVGDKGTLKRPEDNIARLRFGIAIHYLIQVLIAKLGSDRKMKQAMADLGVGWTSAVEEFKQILE